MAIQSIVLAALSAAGIAVSGYLSEDQLPTWANSLIAIVTVFVAAIVYAVITGQFTGNFMVTFAAVSGIIGWLMVGPLAPVHTWMTKSWTGPFAALAEALSEVPVEEPPSTPGAPTSAVAPRRMPRLPLPTTPDLVQRSSLLNDPTWRPTTAVPVSEPRPLQVPSVDPEPSVNSAQAATGPLPAVSPPTIPQPGQAGQGNAQTPGADQAGQSVPPPNPYGP